MKDKKDNEKRFVPIEWPVYDEGSQFNIDPRIRYLFRSRHRGKGKRKWVYYSSESTKGLFYELFHRDRK